MTDSKPGTPADSKPGTPADTKPGTPAHSTPGTNAGPHPAGKPATQPDYETAAARLEEIVRRLDSGEAGLRETLDLVREGRTLIERCAAELEEVSGEVEALRLDELVAALEHPSEER